MTTSSKPLWKPRPPSHTALSLPAGKHVDVAIIGGGLSGLTAAVILAQRGRSIAVLERDSVGSGETGLTTAHVTEAIDARYHHLKRKFGTDGVRSVASSLRAAIEKIAELSTRHSIECAFRRLPGYLYTERRSDIAPLKNEASSARDAGVHASFVTEVPLPFATRGAVRFEDQAQFDPLAYLHGLASQVGARIFEQVQVTNIEDGDPCVIESSAGRLTARSVFIATNSPLNDVFATQWKLAAYRSYAIATTWDRERPDGLFWDTADPYHYTRWHDHYVIIGGEDHKVGQEKESDACFDRLLAFASSHFGVSSAEFRWSGQIIQPSDGLPFIGRAVGKTNLYIATGYAGQGMTYATVAGLLVADLVTGTPNAWEDLYDPGRLVVTKES